MVSLNLLGSVRPLTMGRRRGLTRLQTLIVIGDGALARELMDKRSAKYSGRPVEPYMVCSPRTF